MRETLAPEPKVEKAAPFSTLRGYGGQGRAPKYPLSLWERAGVRAPLAPNPQVEKAAPFSTLRSYHDLQDP